MLILAIASHHQADAHLGVPLTADAEKNLLSAKHTRSISLILSDSLGNLDFKWHADEVSSTDQRRCQLTAENVTQQHLLLYTVAGCVRNDLQQS